MRVLFATAELAPLAVAGELGEAAAGLTTALRAAGVDVEVALPDYERDRTPLAGEERRPLDVPSWAAPASCAAAGTPSPAASTSSPSRGIARSHPYLRPDGAPWPDNAARFLAFSRAVAALVRRDQPDVLHLNGWHAGTTLAALTNPPPTVVSLGDILHQGVTDGTWLARLGPRGRHYEWWGGTNPLSGAIALADAVVAASPNHAARDPDAGAAASASTARCATAGPTSSGSAPASTWPAGTRRRSAPRPYARGRRRRPSRNRAVRRRGGAGPTTARRWPSCVAG